MSLQTLAFLLGCGLIVIGIVGGGIEAKEIKVPKLSPLPRILSAVFGIGLVAGAAGMLSGLTHGAAGVAQAEAAGLANASGATGDANLSAAASPPAARVPAPPPDAGDVAMNGAAPAEPDAPPPDPPQGPAAELDGTRTVRITDQLGPNQDYERIQIYVRGRQVALIAIDRNHRQQSVEIDIREGDEYMLIGTEATTEDGVTLNRVIRGNGIFDSDESSVYAIMLDDRTAEIMTARLQPQ